MILLTPFQLTPLGLFHTLVSLVCVILAFLALARDKEIRWSSGLGRAYLITLIITTLTGLPIFRHGTIGPPHIVGFLTLITLLIGAAAARTSLFGRASGYVRTIAYSFSVLLLMIPLVTETLTRVPPGAPLVAGPESPVLAALNGILLLLFVFGITLQIKRLRAAPAAAR
jgi:hypothetical protein